MSPPRTRTALAVSTLLHALVLGALVLSVRPPPLSSPLSVRFLKLSSESVPRAEASAVGPVGVDARPSSRPTARKDVAVASARPTAPAPVTDTAPEATASAPASASAADRAAEAKEASAQGVAAPGAVSLGGGGSGAGLGGQDARLGELHRRLAEAAARCYPASARRFRLQGQVPLHFCLDAGGTATALRLQGSTGSPLLDRSALECVVPGAQPLSGFEGCFVVPVHFGG